MEGKPHVVVGEAPESDCEDEIKIVQNSKINPASTPQGIVVAGEAPESDEENEDAGSVSSCASVTSVSSTTSHGSKQASSWRSKGSDGPKYSTLLHKKLRERNISLHRDISELANHTIHNATKDLNAINQGLLRSQVTLQEAATSLHVLLAMTVKLKDSLQMTFSSSAPFLPSIHPNTS
ncbi:biogenesis of lysosome-related organelles complex 1 subunit 3 isoform X2 [Hetaerina americana]